MVEHSNSPFVFCNPGFQWSFSLTVVYKNCSWCNWICTLCQIVAGQPFPVLSVEGTNYSQFSMVWRRPWFVASLRFDQSFQKCPAHRVVPRSHWTVDRRGVSTAIFRSYWWRMRDNCCLAVQPWPDSFLRVSLSVLMVCSVLYLAAKDRCSNSPLSFWTSIAQKVFNISGSYSLEELIVQWPFNIQNWFFVAPSETELLILMRQIL